nr:anaerobic sulfatase maturase [uncultured Holophaga sp.]
MAPSLHLMAKPCGAACNLDCSYCFYLEKAALHPGHRVMSDEVLEAYVRSTIEGTAAPEVSFVWQGGEPLLAGIDFYRRALALQARYAGGKTIANAIQTNGLLLDEAWCAFLREKGFSLGISLDGPEAVHDAHRRDRQRQGTFARVMAALERVKGAGIPFNILCCVGSTSAGKGAEVYDFFVRQGIRHIQFSPVVERLPDAGETRGGYRHGTPETLGQGGFRMAPWSVPTGVYGAFLRQIFDAWVCRDVGQVFVMNFEWALTAWLGLPATVCVFAEHCGQSMVVEAGGEVYACDHYVYPGYRLGWLPGDDCSSLVAAEARLGFGSRKAGLPGVCRSCDVQFACRGECPKHRFLHTPEGEVGLNYLCDDYRSFFHHIHPHMKVMAQLVRLGKPAALVMEALRGPLRIEL